MKLLSGFLVIVLQSILLSSCIKEEDPEIIEKTIIINNSLQSDSTSISWLIENIPDSIPIKIKNGQTPYTISTSPSFSSTAKIEANILTLFPEEFRFSQVGRDFITITDAVNQKLTLPINVKTAYSPYDFFLELDVRIQGDTAFSSNQFIIQDAFWDYYEGVLFLRLALSNKAINIWIENIFERGNFKPRRISYSPNINAFPNGDFEFVPKDTAQTISVDSLSTRLVQVSFDFPAFDRRGHYSGDVSLIGQIKMIKK